MATPAGQGLQQLHRGRSPVADRGKGVLEVSALKKDDDGIWRGRAMKNGQQVDVALDYQGNVFHGAAAHGMTGQTMPTAP